MSLLDSTEALRPAPTGLKAWATRQAMAAAPLAFRVLRRVKPILSLGSTVVVTLHDDVREVFGNDADFAVPYAANIDVITGGVPFMLGMPEGPAYRASLAAMQRVCRASDLAALGDAAEAQAAALVAAAPGRIDVVELVRSVTFGVLAPYFGVPPTPRGRLEAWATRLFEFQFTGSPADTELTAQATELGAALRDHLDAEIARRKQAGTVQDDVLGRCLALQAEDPVAYSDAAIRSNILCMIVGGPPQPPMVLPQAMEQLLQRPEALALAQAAAMAGDGERLRRIVQEAMRFDPLAPGLPRLALRPAVIAAGTRRETAVPAGATVLVCFASAMRDARRLPEPERFMPERLAHEYIHFGHGLHECFGRFINAAMLHRMLQPLLRQPKLRRAAGPEGQLTKNRIFAERLVVAFG